MCVCVSVTQSCPILCNPKESKILKSTIKLKNAAKQISFGDNSNWITPQRRNSSKWLKNSNLRVHSWLDILWGQKRIARIKVLSCVDFPGRPVVENSPANAGDIDLISGLGTVHMPWSSWTHEPQLQLESSPHLPQLEKACMQQQRRSVAKNK